MEGCESDLAFIQRCVREGRMLWTYNVNARLRQRGVARRMVTESVGSYQIVEHYPQSQASRYLLSFLVLAEHNVEAIHILFAIDKEGGHVRIITVYRPDPSEWEAGFLRRKRP